MVTLPIRTPDQPDSSITVRGFDVGDVPDLFAVLDYDQVWAYVAGARPRTPAELAQRLTSSFAHLAQQSLVIRRHGRIVGTSSFYVDSSQPTGVEIGSTLFAPELWGSGINSVVKQVMLTAAFSAGAEWVQLRTDERNHRSAAAIRKLPGVVEIESRIEPQWIRADGTIRTSCMFRVPRPAIGSAQLE